MDARTIDEPKFIVVIGTSAGGIRALEELATQLTPDMDAAFFIVLHLSRKGIGKYLFQRLQESTTLPCRIGINGEPIQKGRIYIAPPDEHMLVTRGQVIIGKGAAENRWRPSINNLFRSAAATYSGKVIGIVLTGMLDDGTSGMSSIKRTGGITIVQDPNEAEYPDMPLSVLDNMDVDHNVSLSQMGVLLKEIISNTEPNEIEIPHDVKVEAILDQRVSTSMDSLLQFEKADFSCPECGGGLHITQQSHPTHYRCHVGHSFTDRELNVRMSEALETTIWTSLRMMEERRSLLTKLARRDAERGYDTSASRHLQKAKEMEVHIENLKQILFSATNVD
jgi:two-component system, chemotaxis family, protein-glutamate methylesterase/glutaminase